MKINEIITITNANVVAGKNRIDTEVNKAFSSDLMSDVLTLDEVDFAIITGLANVQLIRTADMADASVILLARGKKATPEMVALAEECSLVLLETDFSLYKTSGELYQKGLEPIY